MSSPGQAAFTTLQLPAALMGDMVSMSKVCALAQIVVYRGHLLQTILSHLILGIQDLRAASLMAAVLSQGCFMPMGHAAHGLPSVV